MAARIHIVRHGETEWSLAGRHTSLTDLPLTDHGREQAEALAGKLAGSQFELILSSPLQRALQTCRLAGFGDAAELCEDLREWDYGEYEGMTTPQIREDAPDWNLWRDGCPGGESAGAVAARVDRVIARLGAVSGDGLVFAHGHVLRVLTARWLAMEPAAGARFMLPAAGVSVLGHERETTVIERWGI